MLNERMFSGVIAGLVKVMLCWDDESILTLPKAIVMFPVTVAVVVDSR